MTSPQLDTGGDGQYHEIASTRILDTRTATRTGTCTPSPCTRLELSTPKSVTVGASPIPTSNVAAVAATVTVSGNGVGYARVNPTATSGAATINFDTSGAANRFVIAPVVNGKIVLEVFGGTGIYADAIVDVTGYYTTATGSAGSTFTPLSPSTRLADTRSGYATGLCPTTTCSTLAANTSKTIQAAGQAGVPATGVRAVVLSFSVANQTGAGYLRVRTIRSGRRGNDQLPGWRHRERCRRRPTRRQRQIQCPSDHCSGCDRGRSRVLHRSRPDDTDRRSTRHRHPGTDRRHSNELGYMHAVVREARREPTHQGPGPRARRNPRTRNLGGRCSSRPPTSPAPDTSGSTRTAPGPAPLAPPQSTTTPPPAA